MLGYKRSLLPTRFVISYIASVDIFASDTCVVAIHAFVQFNYNNVYTIIASLYPPVYDVERLYTGRDATDNRTIARTLQAPSILSTAAHRSLVRCVSPFSRYYLPLSDYINSVSLLLTLSSIAVPFIGVIEAFIPC